MRYFFREWRQHAGLTLRDVATALGVTEGHVSRIETGGRDFTGGHLEDFARLAGCRRVWDPLSGPPRDYLNRVGGLAAEEKAQVLLRLPPRPARRSRTRFTANASRESLDACPDA